MNQTLALCAALLVAAGGILAANRLHAGGCSHYVSRKVGHIAGGLSYLTLALWVDRWPAISLVVGAALLMSAVRLWKPELLKGVGGTGRPHTYAEVTYALAGAASFGIGWGVFNDRWLALTPTLFMAWGDSVTGLVRSAVVKREEKHWSGSIACLAVCSLIALLIQPFWIGLAGAVVATAVERWTGLARGWIDDNWTIVVASLGVMILLKALV